MQEFDRFIDVMHKLRQECPWDKEQTLRSLRTYLIEEAYECLDAMNSAENGDYSHLIEELGDVLLQIAFQSEIISEKTKQPAIQKVISGITEKLIRRHPHIFSDVKAKDAKTVLENWEDLKKKEKGGSDQSLFANFKATGPALQTALKIGQKSERVRFDWDNDQEVWNQFLSELKELQEAKSLAEQEEELGDLLFCLAQWARHRKLDAEVSLESANQKFLRRFRWMEEKAQERKQDFRELDRDQKESLWKEAKAALKK